MSAVPFPSVLVADDAGSTGAPDAGPRPASDDAAPPATADDAGPQAAPDGASSQANSPLVGTWRTNNIPDTGGSYTSFSMDAVLDASGTVTYSTSGVRSPNGAAFLGCTEKWALTGNYTVKGSAIDTNRATFSAGKVNRSGCNDPTNNVSDEAMPLSYSGALYGATTGSYVVAGSTLTITTSAGVFSYTKQ